MLLCQGCPSSSRGLAQRGWGRWQAKGAAQGRVRQAGEGCPGSGGRRARCVGEPARLRFPSKTQARPRAANLRIRTLLAAPGAPRKKKEGCLRPSPLPAGSFRSAPPPRSPAAGAALGESVAADGALRLARCYPPLSHSSLSAGRPLPPPRGEEGAGPSARDGSNGPMAPSGPPSPANAGRRRRRQRARLRRPSARHIPSVRAKRDHFAGGSDEQWRARPRALRAGTGSRGAPHRSGGSSSGGGGGAGPSRA